MTELEEAQDPLTPRARLGDLAVSLDWSVRKEVANNPKTPRAVLSLMSNDDDYAVLLSLAANPRTPAGTLAACLETVKQENPVELWGCIAARERIPSKILPQVVRCDLFSSIGPQAARNPRHSPQALDRLTKLRYLDSQVLIELARHPNMPQTGLQRLIARGVFEAADHPSASADMVAARNPKSPPSTLERIARAHEPLWPVIAENPSTEPELLAQLAAAGGTLVRLGVASNLRTPMESMCRLAKDRGKAVRYLVAHNPSTAPTVLTLMAEARGWRGLEGAYWASDNPATPPATLDMLAANDDYGLRALVAGNPATPPATLDMLAGDDHRWVRASVAGNPATPPATLDMLAGDDHCPVCASVAGNPAMPPASLDSLDWSEEPCTRRTIAGNPSASRSLMNRLARRPCCMEVLVALGENASSPPELLARLAGSRTREVREVAVTNPACPEHIRAIAALGR